MRSSIFQTIFLVICGFALVIGVLIFAGIIPGFRAPTAGVAQTVTLWGTVSNQNFTNLINDINKNANGQFQIKYVVKNSATIDDDLLEALASGTGPDLALLPAEVIFHQRDKLYPIPFASVTQRQFNDLFIDGANLFATNAGFLALPVAVDPLALYYNKDLYIASGLATPPTSWEEFVANLPKLTVFDNNKKLLQSATALGTTNNIINAKDIFALLSLQTGSAPVAESNGPLALDFYTQFSDPTRATYTWGRSQPDARGTFLTGRLANYFGFASELSYILNKNPHLNFDVAPVPRLNKGENTTFGRFYGLAILKRTTKLQPAVSAAGALALNVHDPSLASILGLAPVKRASVQAGTADPRWQVFYREALASQGWADFSPAETDKIIREMINNTATGRLTSSASVKKAIEEMKLLKK